MSLWLALETKAPVSWEPMVLAEVAPTAAPVASSALFTAWPAPEAVFAAASPAVLAALLAVAAVLSAAVPAFLLQAASDRAATAAALIIRTCFIGLSLR